MPSSMADWRYMQSDVFSVDMTLCSTTAPWIPFWIIFPWCTDSGSRWWSTPA